jgi:hypothetical protein
MIRQLPITPWGRRAERAHLSQASEDAGHVLAVVARKPGVAA